MVINIFSLSLSLSLSNISRIYASFFICLVYFEFSDKIHSKGHYSQAMYLGNGCMIFLAHSSCLPFYSGTVNCSAHNGPGTNDGYFRVQND